MASDTMCGAVCFGVSPTPAAEGHSDLVRSTILADRLGMGLMGIPDHPSRPAFLDLRFSTPAPGRRIWAARAERVTLFPQVANLPVEALEAQVNQVPAVKACVQDPLEHGQEPSAEDLFPPWFRPGQPIQGNSQLSRCRTSPRSPAASSLPASSTGKENASSPWTPRRPPHPQGASHERTPGRQWPGVLFVLITSRPLAACPLDER